MLKIERVNKLKSKIIMQKIKLLLILISVLTASVFVFFTGCETMGLENTVNGDIKESVEMEEYILAGLDLQYSLNQFKEELKGIDMLALKPTLDAQGNLVITIPGKINIEEKTKDFNLKKKTLLDKYPELKRMKSVKRFDHIKETADNSLKIAKALMEFEHNNNPPRLRSTPIEFAFNNFADESEAFAFLNAQIGSADYVEVTLVVFENGNIMTVISNQNTAYDAVVHYGRSGEKWYLLDENFNHVYSQSPIAYAAHTHRLPDPASPKDIEAQAAHPGLPMYIYHYGGLMYDVYGNPIN